MRSSTSTVFLLPGWLDSGPSHWQSRWELLHGYHRVQQHDWQRPLRGDWLARLDEVMANHLQGLDTLSHSALPTPSAKAMAADCADKPGPHPPAIVLVAHSLGCHLVAAWAAHSRHAHRVRGALLVAPPDVTRDDLPPDLHAWRAPVLQALPFAATCVISSNDPFASLDAGRAMASAWGAGCVEAGAAGHINGDSHLGDWPQGQALLHQLMKDVPPHGH
jgi:uncharacterized protein